MSRRRIAAQAGFPVRVEATRIWSVLYFQNRIESILRPQKKVGSCLIECVLRATQRSHTKQLTGLFGLFGKGLRWTLTKAFVDSRRALAPTNETEPKIIRTEPTGPGPHAAHTGWQQLAARIILSATKDNALQS
jgi:hypothetical protein